MTRYRITQEWNEDADDPVTAVRYTGDTNNLVYRVEDDLGTVYEVDLNSDDPQAIPITPF